MSVELEPRKIWVDGVLADQCSIRLHETEIPYIREDIVTELVEALKEITRIADQQLWSMPGWDRTGGPSYKARAALSRARGE